MHQLTTFFILKLVNALCESKVVRIVCSGVWVVLIHYVIICMQQVLYMGGCALLQFTDYSIREYQ